MNTCTLAMAIFLINLPFGYWRARCRRLSVAWFAAIHIPVILGITLRVATHVPFSWLMFPVYIAAFALGQAIGSRTANVTRGLTKGENSEE